MRQSVHLDQLASLSDGMKRLAVALDESASGGMAGLERMADSIRSEYGEAYVQGSVSRMQEIHREASRLAAYLDEKTQRQAAELRRAAEDYADAEERNRRLIRSLAGRNVMEMPAMEWMKIGQYSVKGMMDGWARTELARLSATGSPPRIEEDIQRKELQAKVEAYVKSMLPPTHLPDGTLITAANKENELTFAYFNEHVLEKDKEYMNVQVPYTAYVAWVRTIYGRSGWEQALHLSEEFVLGLGTEVITSVIDIGELAIELVIDPAQMTKEAIDAAKRTAAGAAYFIQNPEKVVEVANEVYADFEQMSPEEKARALGAISTILIPGAAMTKVTKAGKVVEGITELTKKVDGAIPKGLDGISFGPVPVPAGPRIPADLSPGRNFGALPRTPVQDNFLRQMEISRSELADLAAGNKGNMDVKGSDSDRFWKVEGTGKDLLSSIGKFNDSKLESDYEKYLARKTKEGKTSRDRLEWKEARDYWLNDSPMARGNAFNKKAVKEDWYPVNELHLSNGKRLDSYDPIKGEIISRKATDLEVIDISTFESYLKELKNKYPSGTVIRSNAYPELDRLPLTGKQILEIPVSNKNFSQIQEYIELAKSKYGIELRFRGE